MGALAAVLLGGCTLLRPRDDPSRFYVLTAPPAVTERLADGEGTRLNIGLQPVGMPAYLRSKSLVVRTGLNELRFAEFDRWAEPLDQGISRVMEEALRFAPNVASVTLNAHGDDSLDCSVAIRIVSCEGVLVENGASMVRFAATWEIRTFGTNLTPTKRGGFTADRVTWDGKTYAQMAGRLSEAIAEASTALAADLQREAAPSPEATPERRP